MKKLMSLLVAIALGLAPVVNADLKTRNDKRTADIKDAQKAYDDAVKARKEAKGDKNSDSFKAEKAAFEKLNTEKKSLVTVDREALAKAEEALAKDKDNADLKAAVEAAKATLAESMKEASLFDKYQYKVWHRGALVAGTAATAFAGVVAYLKLAKKYSNEQLKAALLTPATTIKGWAQEGVKGYAKIAGAVVVTAAVADIVANYIVNGSVKGGFLMNKAYSAYRGY